MRQSSNLKLNLSDTKAHEVQELLCPSQYKRLLGTEVHEQMSQLGGLSEVKPPVFLRPQASLVLIYRPTAAGMKVRVDLAQPVN
ncbi:hypothetical protein TNCV_4698891 [Trichonephila clavipes]|nr:hypothetical protein TNCV_4698891 [Trichonephila clavipes]